MVISQGASLCLGNFGVHHLLGQRDRGTWTPPGTPSSLHPHSPVLGKSPACSSSPVPQLMQPESCLCGDVAAEFLRAVLWGVTGCFKLQFSIPTPSSVPQDLDTSLNRELAMAQLDTMHVLAQPWDQLWESLNLGFQNEESEWKKFILFHLLPPSPIPFRAALLQNGCPFHVPNIFM